MRSFSVRTLAPLVAGSAFAWSISKGYKHGFPLDEHFAFILLSIVCFLAVLLSCTLPKRLNMRPSEPVKVWRQKPAFSFPSFSVHTVKKREGRQHNDSTLGATSYLCHSGIQDNQSGGSLIFWKELHAVFRGNDRWIRRRKIDWRKLQLRFENAGLKFKDAQTLGSFKNRITLIGLNKKLVNFMVYFLLWYLHLFVWCCSRSWWETNRKTVIYICMLEWKKFIKLVWFGDNHMQTAINILRKFAH